MKRYKKLFNEGRILYDYVHFCNIKDALRLVKHQMKIPKDLLDKVLKSFPKYTDYLTQHVEEI